MFAISTTAGGECLSAVDVCVTTPVGVPVPFPNVAQCRNAARTTRRVRIQNKPALTQKSMIAPSFGAPVPPAIGGVLSGTVNITCRFSTFSSRVRIEGAKAVMHMSMTKQNNFNCVGTQATPSQGKVLAAG